MGAAILEKPWLVQKYGGTSLGKLPDTICGNIIPSYLQEYNVAVVCSALSGTIKSNGTTSLLLECITHAEAGYTESVHLNHTIDTIRDNHFRLLDRHIASSNGTHNEIYERTRASVNVECETLRRFLLAAQVSDYSCTYATVG